MKRIAAFLAALSCVAFAQTMAPAQRDALYAAERWFVPVDGQKYADAWAMSAEAFKAGVSRDQFRDGIAGIRKDYGKVVKRSGEKMAFRGQQPAADAGDAPMKAGTEVSILFETTFAGNKQANEEVTMVLEKDGIWRVAGYYIR